MDEIQTKVILASIVMIMKHQKIIVPFQMTKINGRRDVGDVCDDNEADADLFSCEPPILTEKAEGKL